MQVDSPSSSLSHSQQPSPAALPASTPAPPPPAAPSAPPPLQAPLITVSHTCRVSAIHRLHSPSLSPPENLARYGAKAGETHGHEYEFEVVFRGPVCRETGQIMGSELFEDVVGMAIGEVLHHTNLDSHHSFFHSRPSTLENLCLFAWRNCAVVMAPHPFDVVRVGVSVEEGCPSEKRSGRGRGRERVEFSGEMINIPR